MHQPYRYSPNHLYGRLQISPVRGLWAGLALVSLTPLLPVAVHAQQAGNSTELTQASEQAAAHTLIRRPSKQTADTVTTPPVNEMPVANKIRPMTTTGARGATTSLPGSVADRKPSSSKINAARKSAPPAVAELTPLPAGSPTRTAPSASRAIVGSAKSTPASSPGVAPSSTATPKPSTLMGNANNSPVTSSAPSIQGRGFSRLSAQFPTVQQVVEQIQVTSQAAPPTTATPPSAPPSPTVGAPPTVTAPSLAASPASLAFTLVSGTAASAPQTIAVSNAGGGTLTWAASNNQPWLHHSFTPTSVSVTADATGLAAGTYTGAVTLWSDSATNAPKTIPVTLTVTAAPAAAPKISVTPGTLAFSATQGGSNPATQSLALSTSGTGTVSWSVSDNAAWLTTTQSGNTVAASVNVSGLTAGTHTATITVAASGAANTPQTIPVSLTIAAALVASPTISLAPAGFSFSAQAGSTTPFTQALSITNTGGGSFSWTIVDDSSWVTKSVGSGTGNGTVSIYVDPSGLPTGTHTSMITVSVSGAANTPQVVPVTLTLTAPPVAPTIGFTPGGLAFNATTSGGNPANQNIAINNTGTGTLSWSVTDNAGWLTTTQSGNTIVASVNKSGLAAGTYSALITVSASGATNTPQTIPVSLTLTSGTVNTTTTLTWNGNHESDLAGYKIYRATASGAYGAPIAVITGNTTSYTVTGLTAGTTYFFVVTAYDTAGNESSRSNEVTKSIY